MPKIRGHMAGSLSLNTVINAANGGSPLSILTSVFSPTYGIYKADGQGANTKVLSFNSAIKYEHSGKAVITNAPVEQNVDKALSYTSLAKVAQPKLLPLRVVIQGLSAFSGSLPTMPTLDFNFSTGLSVNYDSPQDSIKKLQELTETANLLNIETPDMVYEGYDLISYQFGRTAQSGMSLLIIDLVFQEVRTLQDVAEANNPQEEKSFFEKAKDKISSTVSSVKDSVKSAIEGVKGFF